MRHQLLLLSAFLVAVPAFAATQEIHGVVSDKPPLADAASVSNQDTFLEHLRKNMGARDLEWDAIENRYSLKVELNGNPALLHVDSGAHDSMLTLKAVKRLGLKANPTGKKLRGIGGEEELFTTEIDSLKIGPDLVLPKRKMNATPMVEQAKVCDGLLGADILAGNKALLDYRNHRLLYPVANRPVDVVAKAREFGMAEVVLTRTGAYSFLDATIGGKPAKFLLDTGAQQSVLDTKSANRLGVDCIDTNLVASGVGDSATKFQMASVDHLRLGSFELRKAPMAVISLESLQGMIGTRIDGILGAEFFYAAEALVDIGNKRMFIAPRDLDVRAYAKVGGEMFDSDESLAKAYTAAPWVGSGSIILAEPAAGVAVKGADGNDWVGARLTFRVGRTLKGERLPSGSKIEIITLVPKQPHLAEAIDGIFARNPGKVLFFDPKAAGKDALQPYDRILWTDGELARAQLKRVTATAAVTAKPVAAAK